MEEFDNGNLLLSLIERLNIIAHHFYENRRLDMKSFSYLNYLIENRP